MAKLTWDNESSKIYETGVSKGVLYVTTDTGTYGNGVAWNGLISVTKSPSGAEPTPLYADNKKYITLMSVEEFSASVEAYTYPEEFEVCDGTAELTEGVTIQQQPRKAFGLAFQSVIGNGSNPQAGYKIHLIYGCMAAPTEQAYATINDSPEAMTFSWEISTTPVEVTGHRPTSTLVIDSTKVDQAKLKILEDSLFGTETEQATLLTPNEVLAILK